MRLRRKPADQIVGRREVIARLASTVNDPDLYDRIEKALLNCRAFFFESEDGFAVLRPYPGYMLAWVAISGDHKSRIGLNAYFEELERLAIIAGSPALQFWTVRRGFSRICKQRGYHSRQSEWHGVPITIWEKSL